jgi:hypothetical protein
VLATIPAYAPLSYFVPPIVRRPLVSKVSVVFIPWCGAHLMI